MHPCLLHFLPSLLLAWTTPALLNQIHPTLTRLPQLTQGEMHDAMGFLGQGTWGLALRYLWEHSAQLHEQELTGTLLAA